MPILRRPFLPARWTSKSREHYVIILCGIALTSVIAFLYLFQPQLLSTLDLEIYDTLLKFHPGRPVSDNIIIVDIDTKSLARYGQWPWPRYRLARLLDRLREMGALGVGIDILFAEPDRSSLSNIQKNLSADFNYGLSLAGVPGRYLDNDAVLSEALRRGPFALGFHFSFAGKTYKDCSLHPVAVLLRKDRDVPESFNGLFQPLSADCPYRPLAEAAPASGFINIKTDHDGIIRRVPLLMEYEGRFYPHLSLAVLLAAARPDQVVLQIGPGGTESLHLEDLEVPLEPKGSYLIPFLGPEGTYRHVSAADVLDGTVGGRELEGRIVLIGATAPGLLDIRSTPADPAMAGVEVHANIIDSILKRDFIVRPRHAAAYEFFAVVFFGLLSTVLFVRCQAMGNLIFLSVFVTAAVAATVFLFRNGTYISPLYPVLACASNFSLLSFLDFWIEEAKVKEKIRLQLLTQDAMLETIANITETRDPETGGHIRRTRAYVKSLAEHIKGRPAFSNIVNDEFIECLYQSAPLHDLGKVGVRDNILLKPGALDFEEFEEMKRHTQYGKKVIDAAQAKLADASFLKFAGEMAESHHEHWDGKGYPNGLKGEGIPLSGRIMAIADVYDALISSRPYKKGLSHEEAVEMILAGSGTKFDPRLVEAFAEMHAAFEAITEQFADTINDKERQS